MLRRSLAALLVLFSPAAVFSANLGPHQQPPATGNPCRTCHDTASGTPALKGWAGTGVGPATGWGSKPLSALCYMCHESLGGSYGGHDMSANAYVDLSHGYIIADVPREPEGSPQGSHYPGIGASRLPYVTTTQLECSSCHNVHLATDRPFSQRTSFQALCDECHQGRGNNASLTSIGGQNRSYSTHPTRQSLIDTVRANIKDISVIAATLKVATPAAPNWALGGHLNDAAGNTGAFDCQTCHAVHGPAQGTPGLQDLLAVDNASTAGSNTPSALCEGCHYGGAAGEQVGSVAAYVQAVLPAGSYSDHPIDPGGNRSFYPTGAALPALWTTANPNNDRGAQPMYGPVGTAKPVCSSCHDTHGGIADTPLLRGPQPSGAWMPVSYNDWCFACHSTTQVVPVGHHSVINNLAVALGDAFDSQLTCGDCHGPAGTTEWRAHNGFWTWAVAVAETDSAFCLGCHSATNPADLVSPALKGQTFAEPANFPATHGTVRGNASHYLGPDSDEFPGVVPKTTAWSSTYFSAYGPPNTGGGGAVAPTSGGEIICGSCHNVLYNDGRQNPGNYTSARAAGWQSNLLLERYEDDMPGTGNGAGPYGVGSALCTGCHTKVGNHHPQTGDTVSMSGLALRTGAASFADQTNAPIGGGAAPGTLSYPNVNQLDCDSCHRSHRADDDSDVAGASHGGGTSTDGRPTRHILEVDGPNHRYSADLCAECHSR